MKRLNTALRLAFSVDDSSVTGWESRLITHRVTQRIPVEAAE